MDRPSVKCVIQKFNENLRGCRYLCVLKIHQVSWNSNEKQKCFFIDTLKWTVCPLRADEFGLSMYENKAEN